MSVFEVAKEAPHWALGTDCDIEPWDSGEREREASSSPPFSARSSAQQRVKLWLDTQGLFSDVTVAHEVHGQA